MVVDGRSVVEKMIVTFPDTLFDNEIVVQPNGVDLRAHKIYHALGSVTLERDKKIDTSGMQITEVPLKDGFWNLGELYQHNEVGNYLVDFRESCSMRAGFSGTIVPRSSMLRTGIFVTSAWWDTGWDGRLGASARIRNPIRIEYGAALAQLIVYKSEFNGAMYQGQYQGKDSQVSFR